MSWVKPRLNLLFIFYKKRPPSILSNHSLLFFTPKSSRLLLNKHSSPSPHSCFSQQWGRLIIRLINLQIYSTLESPQCRKNYHATYQLVQLIQFHRPQNHLSLGRHNAPTKNQQVITKGTRVMKYAEYFKDGEILPIPKLVESVEPKTLSLVVTDLRTKRNAGLKKRLLKKY